MKKNSCSYIEELLIVDLDEGVDAARKRLVLEHLRDCAACRDFRDNLSAAFHEIRDGAADDPGEEYWKHYSISMDAKLREKQMENKGIHRWRAAAALLFAVFALLIIRAGIGPGADPTELLAPTGARPALVEELQYVYGPIAYDNPWKSEALEPQTATNNTQMNDVVLSWFEVEDEPLNGFYETGSAT